MKRKILGLILTFTVLMIATGCSTNSNNSMITVVSREDGSGTRGAFTSLFEIEEKDKDGNVVDNITDSAEITNSTSVMITTVAGNKNAIGYISLGALNDNVKTLKIDGVVPNTENILNGNYKIVRPFNVVTKDNTDELSKDFISYILSSDGQKIITDEKYISIGNSKEYKKRDLSGKITVSGSSSIAPVMEKLKEAYCKVNKNIKIELQQSDSSTGISDVQNGVSNIGMASRDLKDSEKNNLVSQVIAKDGIAVIVNKNNENSNLKSEQIKKIFTGEFTDWSEIKSR